MRKTLLIVSALALALAMAPLTAASASTRYKISIHVGPQDIDVSRSHEDAKVTISGRVTGGPVRGKTVYIYRTNNHAAKPKKEYLGTAKLSSSGRYAKKDHPPVGGRWIYEAKKKAYGKLKGAITSHHLDAYQWDYLTDYYNESGALNLPTAGTPLVGHLTTKPRETMGAGPGTDGSSGYSDAYYVEGGGTLVIDTRGYRCKGITFHIGVSDKSEARTGTYQYEVYKGTKHLFSNSMSYGDPVHQLTQSERKSFGENVPDGVFKVKVDAIDGAHNVRFLIGVPKVACTRPSANIG